MALVREPASGRPSVKQGARPGHLVVHEIQPGSIVYRDGEQAIDRNRTSMNGLGTRAVDVARADRE